MYNAVAIPNFRNNSHSSTDIIRTQRLASSDRLSTKVQMAKSICSKCHMAVKSEETLYFMYAANDFDLSVVHLERSDSPSIHRRSIASLLLATCHPPSSSTSFLTRKTIITIRVQFISAQREIQRDQLMFSLPLRHDKIQQRILSQNTDCHVHRPDYCSSQTRDVLVSHNAIDATVRTWSLHCQKTNKRRWRPIQEEQEEGIAAMVQMAGSSLEINHDNAKHTPRPQVRGRTCNVQMGVTCRLRHFFSSSDHRSNMQSSEIHEM